MPPTDPSPIDPDRLAVFARTLDTSSLFIVLDRALARVPKERLPELLHQIRHEDLAPDPSATVAAERFASDCESDKYYEEFDITWKNSLDMSRGTRAWHTEWKRIAELATEASESRDHTDATAAFDTLFRLAEEAFCEGRYLFIADTGGYYCLAVDWKRLLRARFRSLAVTARSAEHFAEIAVRNIEDTMPHERDDYVNEAKSLASAEQASALEVLVSKRR